MRRLRWKLGVLASAVLSLSLATLALAQSSGVGSGYWHTSGNEILDASGNVVRIAGVNWYGFETTDQIIHGLWAQDYHSILNLIKSSGYNTIRMPFSNQMVEQPIIPTNFTQTVNGQAVNTDLVGLNALQIMDKVITAAGQAGLKVILDNHRSEAGNSNEANGLWYTSQFPESNWINDWVTLAKRYQSFTDSNGNPIVIGMDLRNEPHVLVNGARTGACWQGDTQTLNGCPATDMTQNWTGAATRAGNAILAVNPKLLIFVEGNDCYNTDCGWQGGNLEGVATNPVTLSVPNQLVYSAHDYGPDLFRQPWFTSTTTAASLAAIWAKFWNYVSTQGIAPVWLGEFGTTNTPTDIQDTTPGSQGQWFSSLVAFIGSWPNLSWTYWAANGEDSFALLANQYNGIANAQKQSMLAANQFPLALGGAPDFSLSASPASLTIPQNANGQSTITVTPTGGFSSTVNLSISGLPAGVTASFSANPTTTGAVLTFVTQGNAATGPATITITGTGGSVTHTTTIALTIGSITPTFVLSASPASLSITQGTSGSSTITMTPGNGFASSVNLSVSGLPTGVTATFGSNPITSTSLLTLTASSSAATGPATVLITGTSGALTQTASIALTVNSITPAFSLSASPETVIMGPGGSGSSTITVTPSSGFTGSVNLSVSGLPTGVTASFDTNPTTSGSVLTFTASGTAPPEAAMVTVTGTSGSLTQSTTIELNVRPAFTLSASPATLTVNQGSSGSIMINLLLTPSADPAGFNGTATLSASGLPAGVTATFAPQTIMAGSPSTLTLVASNAAATGSFTLTITGTSGGETADITIPVTVGPGITGTACHIDYTINSQWPSGFTAAITINNTGTTPISAWILTWSFANGQTVTNLWNGSQTQSGANVTVTSLSYNGSIPSGGSYNGMGFQGTWDNSTNAVPTAFSLNGTPCQ